MKISLCILALLCLCACGENQESTWEIRVLSATGEPKENVKVSLDFVSGRGPVDFNTDKQGSVTVGENRWGFSMLRVEHAEYKLFIKYPKANPDPPIKIRLPSISLEPSQAGEEEVGTIRLVDAQGTGIDGALVCVNETLSKPRAGKTTDKSGKVQAGKKADEIEFLYIKRGKWVMRLDLETWIEPNTTVRILWPES